MFTYKDRQWCSIGYKCKNIKCDRKLTPRDIAIIKQMDMLVSYGNMKTDTCGYIPKEEENVTTTK